MIIQFILSIVLLGALFMTWRRAHQQAIRSFEAWLWSLVWMGAGVIIWRPEVTNVVANFVGIGRGADLIVYAAVIVLLILVFHLHVAHDRLERQLTELVRRDALKEVESLKLEND
ncbi:MAG: DUF2304 domain-containing protein [Candidatus Uhrbacteria bacterium]|nr:DUF2304 domain-containing protein [Candidatus Uhrbacteria bacterium]MDP3794223.1 DUF2304 domain-containing protein [Candidatus Uhrbacteria bacterium]